MRLPAGTLKGSVLRYEGKLIAHALRESGGSVHKASQLLNMNSHQALLYILNVRHKELLTLCTRLLGPRERSRKHGFG